MPQPDWQARFVRSIADEIRHRRENRKMSAQQLAAACTKLGLSISRSTLADLENGRRTTLTVAELLVIAAALDVVPLRLLVPLDDRNVEMLPGAEMNPWKATRDFAGLDTPEMRALAEFDTAQRNLRALLRASMNRGGWFLDVPQRRMAQNAYRELLQMQQRIADQFHAQPELDADLREWTAKPGFANGSDRPPVVAAIVISAKGVLVGQRRDGKPPWTFIAGEQDAVKDENPADTAVREVKEETGLRIVAGEVIGERVHPQTGRTMIYVAGTPTHGTDVFVGDEAELAEVRWVSLAEVGELLPSMFGPVREYLDRELGEA
jgi:8-oxo-dGTP diphosphatase